MDYQVDEYREIGKRLKERLDLETDLVAIKFIKDVSEIPEGFLRPLKDTGKKMTLCMAIHSARRDGTKYAMTAYDNPCVINAALGWTKVPLRTLVKSQVDNHWQTSFISMLRVNTQRLRMGAFRAQWPFSRFLGYKGFLVSPLPDTPFIPDTVQIYAYPEQIAHVCHSFSYEGKHVPRSVLTGYGESCFAGAFFPFIAKNPIFVLLGMGDRGVAAVKKYEVGMGMPASLVFDLDKNLFKAGAEHNLLHYLENPPTEVDEDFLPGWRDVQEKSKY